MKIAVFGGAGFIGSHFVDSALAKREISQVLVLDSLTYAGRMSNLAEASRSEKFIFKTCDIRFPEQYEKYLIGFDFIVNFAAESHVDRSLVNPDLFLETNTLGVGRLMATALKLGVPDFLQVSTDEVYGSLASGEASENTILDPSSPYSASKAGGELLALSFAKTWNINLRVTRGCNTYGPRQYPEKLIPLAISRIKEGKKVPIYGDGSQMREWIHVMDHVDAIWSVIRAYSRNIVMNIGSGERFTNLDIVFKLIDALGASRNQIEYVTDRLGHDFRYALDSTKIRRETNWSPTRKLSDEILNCANW